MSNSILANITNSDSLISKFLSDNKNIFINGMNSFFTDISLDNKITFVMKSISNNDLVIIEKIDDLNVSVSSSINIHENFEDIFDTKLFVADDTDDFDFSINDAFMYALTLIKKHFLEYQSANYVAENRLSRKVHETLYLRHSIIVLENELKEKCDEISDDMMSKVEEKNIRTGITVLRKNERYFISNIIGVYFNPNGVPFYKVELSRIKADDTFSDSTVYGDNNTSFYEFKSDLKTIKTCSIGNTSTNAGADYNIKSGEDFKKLTQFTMDKKYATIHDQTSDKHRITYIINDDIAPIIKITKYKQLKHDSLGYYRGKKAYNTAFNNLSLYAKSHKEKIGLDESFGKYGIESFVEFDTSDGEIYIYFQVNNSLKNFTTTKASINRLVKTFTDEKTFLIKMPKDYKAYTLEDGEILNKYSDLFRAELDRQFKIIKEK